jgi:hypothetical protein
MHPCIPPHTECTMTLSDTGGLFYWATVPFLPFHIRHQKCYYRTITAQWSTERWGEKNCLAFMLYSVAHGEQRAIFMLSYIFPEQFGYFQFSFTLWPSFFPFFLLFSSFLLSVFPYYFLYVSFSSLFNLSPSLFLRTRHYSLWINELNILYSPPSCIINCLPEISLSLN